MDTSELPMNYMEEGRRYLASIEALGLRPTVFLWAYDHAISAFVLVLAAEEFDHAGPLELSRLLFKAYNASATPSEIDPLLIRLHSPDHTFIRNVENTPMGSVIAYDRDGKVMNQAREEMVIRGNGMEIDTKWIYRLERRSADRKTVDILRRWHRFERNVDRLAA